MLMTFVQLMPHFFLFDFQIELVKRVSVDTTTGISAHERAYTMKKCADDNAQPDDFRRPGHVFPLRAREGGVLRRTGHTEATVDLCKLAGLKPVGICCEIMSEDGNMARTPELKEFAKEHG